MNGDAVAWMQTEDVDPYLLDVLVDDLESIPDILGRLNAESPSAWWRIRGAPFDRQELVLALGRLIGRRLISAYSSHDSEPRLVALPEGVMPDGDWNDAWFGITPAGRIVHASWNPPRAA